MSEAAAASKRQSGKAKEKNVRRWRVADLQRASKVTQITLEGFDVDGEAIELFMKPQPARMALELVEFNESASQADVMRKLVEVLAQTLCDEDGESFATVDEMMEVDFAIIGAIMDAIQKRFSGGGKAGPAGNA